MPFAWGAVEGHNEHRTTEKNTNGIDKDVGAHATVVMHSKHSEVSLSRGVLLPRQPITRTLAKYL